MSVLSVAQRKVLSDVVAEAREVVEVACAQRVSALGVAADRVPDALSEDERRLRRGLRARARQLGSVDVLVSEAGFEQWHRMLFTRYLADNALLVDDDTGQSVTISEVAEYAAELGEPDMWEVAARFAAAMLPGIFRQEDPVLQMRLPVETRQKLENLLDRLPPEVITAEDSLGWVYQYWQARRKEEVNRSERKIGGADLAPVTQLFTENYMVRFLLENSLGAWWAARDPDSPLISGWEYLRYAEDGTPAAGSFDEWPKTAAEVTVMDPCCGSGHFLVAAFGMLWRMRAEEGLDTAAAQEAVLRDNLFGLELDPRCTQIATFALALEAWKTGGYRPLPLPNIACSGIPAKAPLSDWTAIADGDHRVEGALGRLHSLFVNADTLGSLIDPVRATEQAGLESVDWHTIAPFLHKALANDSRSNRDPAAAVFGDAAAGIARAADYLTRIYTLIATNPPFLGQTKFGDMLRDFLSGEYPEGRYDLVLGLMQRWMQSRTRPLSLSVVSPADWLIQVRTDRFRELVAGSLKLQLIAECGYHAFTEPLRVQPLLSIANTSNGVGATAVIDAADSRTPAAVAGALRAASLRRESQGALLSGTWTRGGGGPATSTNLGDLVEVREGLKAGDVNRFEAEFWEVPLGASNVWELLQTAPDKHAAFRGRTSVVRWENEAGQMAHLAESVKHLNHVAQNWRRGKPLWGREGVAFALMGDLAPTVYSGERFSANCAAIVPRDSALVTALWAYADSGEWSQAVRAWNRGTAVTPHALVKVPFDAERWRAVAAERYADGLPAPFSNDPTQWLFKGDPVGSAQPLQVAVARLLGFSWPDQQPDTLDELADPDGVVCLPAVGGEPPASERLLALLARAYGEDWNPTVLDEILPGMGAKSGGAGLAAWLRSGFFKDHCKLFYNRPFIWQIWDGTPDGFSALVNYHRLDRRLLERLTYDYLGNWWLGRLRDEVVNEVPGAEKRLVAAQQLKNKLQLILEGEPPYDIYVRWKTLAEQPCGWDPDLDDGVRLNIRPFMTAGILRINPNINWKKDRGKNPDGSERDNDLNYTIAQKQAARGAA
jgi:hypothetical protein